MGSVVSIAIASVPSLRGRPGVAAVINHTESAVIRLLDGGRIPGRARRRHIHGALTTGIRLAVRPGVSSPSHSPMPAPAFGSPELEDAPTEVVPMSEDGDEANGAAAGPSFDLSDSTQVDEQRIIHAERDPHVGATLGAYTIVRRLARGGMGVVYLGRHVRLGRKVAIKLPHSHVLRDSDLRRRFLSEAMAAVQIAHPGVVNVLDYGHGPDETPYLVMELLEGGSLADKMADGPVPIDMAVGVATRVADTLAAAHESGVIHRDLKPENIFLQRLRHRPERLTVKVLDFGFAKLVGGPAAGGVAPLTQQGLVVGTPCYMSPEQCLGFAPVDHRTDIYSLGCLLYEMVTGRLPFSGGISEVKLALRYRPAVPPRWHNRDLPHDLDALIMKLLGKMPADRPADMIEVARGLESIGARRVAERNAATAKADADAPPVVRPAPPRHRPIWVATLGGRPRTAG
jgi:Protein kinase domain